MLKIVSVHTLPLSKSFVYKMERNQDTINNLYISDTMTKDLSFNGGKPQEAPFTTLAQEKVSCYT